MMETRITCPLGSKCETAKDGYIERCAWLVQMEGISSNSGDKVKESKCAMAWFPILQVETTAQTLGVNSAICSMREENIKRQDVALSMQRQHLNKLEN